LNFLSFVTNDTDAEATASNSTGERRRPFIGRARLASQRPKPGRYRHYKGQYYEVIETALHSETLQAFVVYRALYGEGNLWVRPRSMFLGTVEVDGKKVPRFTFVESSED
jgi:hypothetical protein